MQIGKITSYNNYKPNFESGYGFIRMVKKPNAPYEIEYVDYEHNEHLKTTSNSNPAICDSCIKKLISKSRNYDGSSEDGRFIKHPGSFNHYTAKIDGENVDIYEGDVYFTTHYDDAISPSDRYTFVSRQGEVNDPYTETDDYSIYYQY